MKKLIFCFSLLCTGLIASCIDKNEEVDEDSMPSWLGSSIYDELSTRSSGQLTGTFNTYLRLIDDLGYAETLSRTGSKTIFPANDEAFDAFFNSDNAFGVRSYEELTESQKKCLLYYSMLDNAILTGGLDNVNTGGTVTDGAAIKHPTNLSVIDTVAHVANPTALYPNNPFWRSFGSTGLYTVNDATTPMIVHFTRGYFLNNEITTVNGEGGQSDFSILMGEDYDGSSTYVLRNKVISPDVTCQNGYIHQVENVIVPPGNLAQLLKKRSDATIISRMMDRFAYPYYDAATTEDYNDWAMQNGRQQIGEIYDVRYLSTASGATDETNSGSSADERLVFNPGWNAYTNSTSGGDAAIMSLGAMLVPTDEAMRDYFLNGAGAAVIGENAPYPDDIEGHFIESLDSIPRNLVASILNNLMKGSFVTTVPSKFSSVTNDVYDPMGLELSDLKTNSDGTYDIEIANNAVVYYLNTIKAPVTLSAVSGVARIRNNMKVMRWAITDVAESSNPTSLLLDFYAYLQAMSANFGLYLPTDNAFDKSDFFYLDVATLGREGMGNYPEAVHYYYTTTTTIINNVETEQSTINASLWQVDPNTYEVVDSIGVLNIGSNMDRVRAHFQDILNYHTVVFNSEDNPMLTYNGNRYYKTKHGGEIMIDGTAEGNHVMSGGQINSGLPAATVERVYDQDNGTTFEIDRLIQGPTESVYKVLSQNPQFSEFLAFCEGFGDPALMELAGISSVPDENTGQVPMDRYLVFDANDSRCLDYNVSFFNSYNYTVYAPNNEAMAVAYQHGLPEWSRLDAWYQDAMMIQEAGMDVPQWYTDSLYNNIQRMRDFVRLHFQRNSVYVDNQTQSGTYSTFLTDDLGISQSLIVNGGTNTLTVTDLSGASQTIRENGGGLVNRMARDLTLSDTRTSTSTALHFTTSSFAVVHEVSQPLYYNSAQSYFRSFNDSSSATMLKSKKR